MTNPNNNNPTLDIILYGETQVGKSTFLQVLTGQPYLDTYKATIIHFYPFSFNQGEKTLNFNFIDASGQKRFKALNLPYIRQATLVLCFDLTNLASFQCLDKHLKRFHKWALKEIQPSYSVLVLGMKSDLVTERQVSQEVIEDYLAQHPRMHYVEVSAKANHHMDVALNAVASAAMENQPPVANTAEKKESSTSVREPVDIATASSLPLQNKKMVTPLPSRNFHLFSAYLMLGLIVGTVVGCVISALTLNPLLGAVVGLCTGSFAAGMSIGAYSLFKGVDTLISHSPTTSISPPQKNASL